MSRLVYGWLTGLVASLPLRVGYALAALFTEIHLRAFPSRRHAALANLAVMVPGASRRDRLRIVRRMMRSYNEMLFEFFRLPHMERDELLDNVETVGREHLETAFRRGKGVVITCTHLGNWELAAVVLAHWGYPVHAVAGVQLSRWLAPAVRDTKTELAIHTVSPEDGYRKLLRALSQGDMIALMVDGDLFQQGDVVQMFGRDTRWPSGPGVLAQRTGASIVCGFCERTGPGRFRIVTEAPLDPDQFESAAAMNARVAEISSRHIRQHLDQWCVFRPLWEPAAQTQEQEAAARRRVTA